MVRTYNGQCTRVGVPQILIPRYRDVISNVGVALYGEMQWQLIETRRFRRPVVIQQGCQKNLIVDAGFDAWLENWSSGLAPTLAIYFQYMAVGTGTTAPSVVQTALDYELARVQYTTRTLKGGPPPYWQCQYTFNENQANGDLTEWGAFKASTGAPMWCRELFRDELGNPVVVTKTNTQVLLMQYTLYMQRTVDSVSTQFLIDGTTYTCVTTINNAQLRALMKQIGISYGVGYGIEQAYVRTGTSNTASNLATDAENKLYGTIIMHAQPAQDPAFSTYTSGSRQRSITYYLGPTESNGNIGEFVNGLAYNGTADADMIYGSRVTFTPTIAKDSSKKVVLTITYSFNNVA